MGGVDGTISVPRNKLPCECSTRSPVEARVRFGLGFSMYESFLTFQGLDSLNNQEHEQEQE